MSGCKFWVAAAVCAVGASCAMSPQPGAPRSGTGSAQRTNAPRQPTPPERRQQNAPRTAEANAARQVEEYVARFQAPPPDRGATTPNAAAASPGAASSPQSPPAAPAGRAREKPAADTPSTIGRPVAQQPATPHERGAAEPAPAPQAADRDLAPNGKPVRAETQVPRDVTRDAAAPPAKPAAPPRIVSVSVRPAGEPEAASSSPEAAANRPAGGGGDAGLVKRIGELERVVAANPNDLDAQLRLRMLYLSDGQDARALALTPGMTREVEEAVTAMTRVMLSARSAAGRDAAQWANRQLSSLESLRAVLKRRADLRVPRVALCRSVGSFGEYEEFAPADFPAGQETAVLAYVEVANFASEPTADGRYKTELSVRCAILDRSGQEVWSRTLDRIADVSRNQREDFFVALPLALPATLNPGAYYLKVSVTDLGAGKSNENQAPFRLVAS